MGRATTDIGDDAQFEHGDASEVDQLILDLPRGALWTEVPLLAHELVNSPAAISRPPEHELLCALDVRLAELQKDAT